MSHVSRAGAPRRGVADWAAPPTADSDFFHGWILDRLGGAERRQVAVFSCAMVLPRVADADPEAVAQHMARFRQKVEAVVARYQGYGPRFAGSVAHAYWGYPRSEENPARLALLAALDFAQLSTPQLGLKCAVDSGLVITGMGGAEPGADVVGTATHGATLLQTAAPLGAVLTSDIVRQMTSAAFRFALAEFPAPRDSWRVIEQRPGWTRAAQVKASKIVGRTADLDAIDRFWTGIRQGRPKCLSIAGEAGMGKSTLLQHLKGKVVAEGGRWIEAQCAPERQRAPLLAVRGALRDALFDPDWNAPPLDAIDRRERDLVDSFLRHEGAEANASHSTANAGTRNGQLFEALASLVAAMAQSTPLLLAFEDIHWADEATLRLVEILRDRLHAPGRVGIACTWRSCEGPLQFGSDEAMLTLEGLSPPEIALLLRSDDHGAALSASARQQIAHASEGNPLFAVELARLHAAKAGSSRSDVLLEPGSLNGVLRQRLDALEHLKPLAQVAATIGLQFELPVLADVLQMDEAQLAPGVSELIARGCLVAIQGKGGLSYRFAHPLLRDAAHASILKSRRRDLHASIAEALSREREPAAAAERSPAVIAGHYAEAEDHKGAFLWWRKAGERAAGLSLARAAAEHFQEALAARRSDPAAASTADEVEVLRMLAIQLVLLKGNGAPEVVETLQQCLKLAHRGGSEHFDALWALQACHLVLGEIARALEIGEELVSAATHQASDGQRLRAHRVQGLAMLLAGRLEEAMDHYRLAISIYDPKRHGSLKLRHGSDQGAVSHAQLSWAEAIAGRIAASSRNARAALDLAARLKHPHTTAHVACVLAARAQTLGDLNVASALAHTGKTLGGQFEFPYWCAWADIILGWVEGSRGSANGMALIENAMTAYRRTGAVQALPYALLLLAETALAVGKPKRALRAARQGWHLARQYRLDLYAAELLRVRTMAKMQLGLPPRSLLVLVSEAQHLAEKQGAVTFSARATRLRDTLSSVDG